jgi:aspartate racemase
MIGLVGGMSWRSTALYHQRLNEASERRFGAHANTESVIVSLRYDRLLAAGHAGDWSAVADAIAAALDRAAAAGATLGLLAAVTPHRIFDRIAAASAIPLLHVLDPAIAALASNGTRRVGLMGTSYTLAAEAFADRFAAAGIDVVLPDADARAALDRMIQDELTQGVITESARTCAARIASGLASRGADAVLLACTELPMLDWSAAGQVAVMDAVALHAEAAIAAARA